MFVTTPARIGFPRPFMWDDGFHNLINSQWDENLVLQSLHDWFNTMTRSDWIPREQPRGDGHRGEDQQRRQRSLQRFVRPLDLLR
jgi:mannosyl-oligosaccharide glucosidase